MKICVGEELRRSKNVFETRRMQGMEGSGRKEGYEYTNMVNIGIGCALQAFCRPVPFCTASQPHLIFHYYKKGKILVHLLLKMSL